jgi:hypothetical protein
MFYQLVQRLIRDILIWVVTEFLTSLFFPPAVRRNNPQTSISIW